MSSYPFSSSGQDLTLSTTNHHLLRPPQGHNFPYTTQGSAATVWGTASQPCLVHPAALVCGKFSIFTKRSSLAVLKNMSTVFFLQMYPHSLLNLKKNPNSSKNPKALAEIISQTLNLVFENNLEMTFSLITPHVPGK